METKEGDGSTEKMDEKDQGMRQGRDTEADVIIMRLGMEGADPGRRRGRRRSTHVEKSHP